MSTLNGDINLPAGNRVGILGGSFNPAHDGHLHISAHALKRLNLDWVWWLVSPQNPLKPTDGMASLGERLKDANEVAAANPSIFVSDTEVRLETRYSVDSLRKITKMFPETHFVWLMGADNLDQIDKWYGWEDIFGMLPIAVFARPPYSLEMIDGQAVQQFSQNRVAEDNAIDLVTMTAPAWTCIEMPLHEASSTKIRSERATKL